MSDQSRRNLLADIAVTFGINNTFDTRAPLSADDFSSNFDTLDGVNYIQRYFWFSVDKKF